MLCCFFFFKQKTAYELRISDWSSDVCSSDLLAVPAGGAGDAAAADEVFDVAHVALPFVRFRGRCLVDDPFVLGIVAEPPAPLGPRPPVEVVQFVRSEESGVWQEGVSTCSPGCATYH